MRISLIQNGEKIIDCLLGEEQKKEMKRTNEGAFKDAKD
jgi:hypothetical protein